MEEYREHGKPTATSIPQCEDVVMDAWQKVVADFDRVIADGKETFTTNPTQQSVQEEYSTYVMSALSARTTFDTLGFWKVGFLQICVIIILICQQTHEFTFPTIFRIAMDYLPIQASAVPCERVFSSSAETDTKKRNRITPALMEALQVLKFSLKKSRLNFTAHLQLSEHPPPSGGPGPDSTLMEMLKLKPDALKNFLDAANFDN